MLMWNCLQVKIIDLIPR